MKQIRKSAMEIGEIYFYTSTIVDWKKLLKPDNLKEIIVESLKYLVENKLIEVYGFVIMPNHIHLIWQLLKLNNKEYPDSSFSKFTSSQFKKILKAKHPAVLAIFESDKKDRDYQFWQRDPLAIQIFNKEIFNQKLNYIHNNPIVGKWNLAKSAIKYKYSSALFYETGVDNFGFLTHYEDSK
jgi:putative transposase